MHGCIQALACPFRRKRWERSARVWSIFKQAIREQRWWRSPGASCIAPECAEARIFLGLANALTCNIYPALDELEKATDLQPDSFAAHFTLAQLNFKLRIPEKGYAAAREALRCASNLEQRAMLTQLLKEERARERNGIARPSFSKPWFRFGWFKKRMQWERL